MRILITASVPLSCCTENNNPAQICFLQPLICVFLLIAFFFNDGNQRAPWAVSGELPDVFYLVPGRITFLAGYVPKSGFGRFQNQKKKKSLASVDEYHFSHKSALYLWCGATLQWPIRLFARLRWKWNADTSDRLSDSVIKMSFWIKFGMRACGGQLVWPLCLTLAPAEIGPARFHAAASSNCGDRIYQD